MSDHLTDLQLAYLAGLTDADGSIFINRSRSCYPTITWAMTHLPTVEYVADLVGSKVLRHTASTPQNPADPVRRNKPQYRAQLTGKRCVALCARMAPFMVTKRRQAEIVQAWPDGIGMDDWGWITRLEILNEMYDLNHTKETAA